MYEHASVCVCVYTHTHTHTQVHIILQDYRRILDRDLPSPSSLFSEHFTLSPDRAGEVGGDHFLVNTGTEKRQYVHNYRVIPCSCTISSVAGNTTLTVTAGS